MHEQDGRTMTYISIQHSALPEALGLVVVVDAEFFEQNLVLVC